MSRNTSSSAAQQDQFLTGLQSWVNAAPDGENGARDLARRRIIEARNFSSTSLDLRHLRLTSLPAEIGNLSRLLYLNLDGNELTPILVVYRCLILTETA